MKIQKLVAKAAVIIHRGNSPKEETTMSKLMRAAIPLMAMFVVCISQTAWAEDLVCDGVAVTMCKTAKLEGCPLEADPACCAMPLCKGGAAPQQQAAVDKTPAQPLPSCPDGQKRNKKGKCVDKPVTPSAPLTPPTSVEVACGAGQIKGADNKCICDNSAGYALIGGQCVNSFDCPPAFTVKVGSQSFTCDQMAKKVTEVVTVPPSDGAGKFGSILWLLAIVGAIASLWVLLLLLGDRKRNNAKDKVEQLKKELAHLYDEEARADRFLADHTELVEKINKARSQVATIISMEDLPEEALTKTKAELTAAENINRAVTDQLNIKKGLPAKIKATKEALKTAEAELSAILTGKPALAAPTAKKDDGPTKA